MKTEIVRELEWKLKSGALDRRQFIMSAIAAGATVSGALGLADKAAAATPQSGGLLRIGIANGATTDSLDPSTHKTTMMSTACNAYCNYLTEIAPNGELLPELAESFEPTPDAKTWVFKIRKGIEFHNGKTMTPEDVLASIQHHAGADSKSSVKSIANQIEEFKKDGNDTVVLTLKTANADFPYLLTNYHLPILPSEDGKIDWNSGIGTGGYKVDAFEPGIRTHLKKNPNYWKEGRAHVDEAELTLLLDSNARQTAVATGTVDAIEYVDGKTQRLLAKNPDLRLVNVTGGLHHTFPMRVDAAPFDNLDFRLAIKHAVDRQEILEKIFFGGGSLGNDQPVSSAYEFFAEMDQRQQDLDKAKFHLKKSGVGDVTVDLSASDGAYAGALDTAVLIQAQCAKAGIKVNVVREAADGYWSDVWRKKPWCAAYWNGRATADWILTDAFSEGSAYNDAGWKHERFNKLLVEARGLLDKAKRAEMYREMQMIVRDEAATLIATFGNYNHALRNNVQTGEQVSASWSLDGGRAVERWWMT